MPLISLDGREAVRIRKKNEYATWGSRNTENRVEPIANPAFDVPFQLTPGEKIFTIGSCFARNVESELIRRGFRIPIRELFEQPSFKGLPREIVNNFGTPSIFNEFAWAFGEKIYDEEKSILEVGKNRYIDLHMVNSIRPAALKTVRQRRKGLIDATRTLAECRVMIMTLGLVELWWDTEAQTYLNTGPLPSILEKHPDRFALHVLSFEECHTYLRQALDIAFANAKDDLSVILTVSPVPMVATHRPTDVIAANTYSKSVLRAVAEQIIAEDPRVSYFPSFETVSLSDRNFSWTEDFVHVNKDMIALNVERMVNAFTGNKTLASAILTEVDIEPAEPAEALLLAERAREARASGDGEFFEEHSGAAKSSPAFALEYAKFLYETQRPAEVIGLARKDRRPAMQVLAARSMIASGKPARARNFIRPLCLSDLKETDHWEAYVEAAIAMKSESTLLQIEKEWLKFQPRNTGYAQARIGRALHVMGHYEAAIDRLLPAATLPDRHIATVIYCAACLHELGRNEEAQKMIRGVSGKSDWQLRQIRQIKQRIKRALDHEKR
ncbi:GSCFA domain-containing protein [Parasphingopyxis sp.]|uniref:GSCFA domain-containing protein n=1 Tax=Parasphingopyxis sp. TaxID=1920299 RepID=UPI002603A7F7|nr:GSCFA domain-containing protein [Parasphingopyxis sp.]